MSKQDIKTLKKIKWTDDKPFSFLQLIASLFIALIVTFVVLLIVSDKPTKDFVDLLTYPLQSKFFFGYVLIKMVPLCFAGLATLLYFKSGLFNLSTEGIFYICGVFCTIVAVNENFMTGNSFVDSSLAIIIPGLLGGLIALGPGILKAKYNTGEMVISLMLNSILFGIGFYIVKTFLAVEGITGNASAPFIESAKLNIIIKGTQVHSGFILMLIAVIAVYILLYKTTLGYQIRMTGLNKNFARYSGMSATGLILIVHFLAGFLGAAGSSIELLGIYKRFSWTMLPGLGFTGALMTMLGKNHPIGVLIAAFGISYLRASAQLLANSSAVIDVKLISLVEVVLTLLISSQYFLRNWRNKKLIKEEITHE
ncbi:MAG: ABC transporter permease [Bacillota bacterium]|jgi:simple sugar transport system permease protein|nr:ABC transporter permease [Bacillota bacterium]NLP22054.1 ABC transporter permease [Erysipelotrichaceae bacterium]